MPQDSSSAQEVTAPTASAAPAQQMPVNAQPQQATMQPAAQPSMQPTMQPVNQAPVKVAKGMNPPHGQPGHRCDIAVGAPLNSPAKATPAANASPITINPSKAGAAVAREVKPGAPALLSAPSATPAPVKTAPGMNPPHGQEGHRCDIAVGAPLNSAPTPTQTPAAVTPAK